MRIGLQTLKKIPRDSNVWEKCMEKRVLNLGMENMTLVSNDERRRSSQ